MHNYLLKRFRTKEGNSQDIVVLQQQYNTLFFEFLVQGQRKVGVDGSNAPSIFRNCTVFDKFLGENKTFAAIV